MLSDPRSLRSRGPRRPAVSLLAAALAIAWLVSVFAAPSIADAQGRRRNQSRSTRTISFEDDVVETSYLRPETSKVEVLDTKRRQSLIRLRTDFFAEIIRSAENL